MAEEIKVILSDSDLQNVYVFQHKWEDDKKFLHRELRENAAFLRLLKSKGAPVEGLTSLSLSDKVFEVQREYNCATREHIMLFRMKDDE